MKRNKKNFVVLAALLIIVGIGVVAINLSVVDRHNLLKRPVVQHFMHIYHSFRKIPDLVFIPYSIFTKSDLDRYELFISGDNIARLNDALQESPFSGLLLEENKVWVNADFRAGDYVGKVKVRYRGNLAIHWNSYKKSYLIKFPKDNLFNGMRELTLIIPYDRKYFSTSLNNYRAQKMGVITPQEYFVNISVNGGEDGVMLAMEHWSQEWIEKLPISPLSKLYGSIDMDPTISGDEEFSIFYEAGREYWKSWNDESDSFPEIDSLIELLEHSTDEEFKRLAPLLIDLESFYATDITRILAGGYHFGDNGNNVVLLFDATEGRFKDVPFNVGINPPSAEFIGPPLLQGRIFSIPEFKLERDSLFNNYIKENSSDDLTFVDSWIKNMKREFYSDHAKLQSTFMFLSSIKGYREDIQINSNPSADVLVADDQTSERKGIRSFPESFSFLTEAGASKEEFVRRFPQFYTSSGNVVLPSGTYYFANTVIVPHSTKLIIKPGTRIFMGENASFVSYSPVELSGGAYSKIEFLPARADKGWGVFAVINAEKKKSFLDHTIFDGGGEATINGVLFSGMAAFHNSDVEIYNSQFKNAYGDDGLNVKNSNAVIKNNSFSTNISDAIDLDAVSAGSVISNNIFIDNKGDAIDTSFTEALIIENIIEECFDKGISVGERSKVRILKNNITGCAIGIAVKDQSHAAIEENTISGTRTAVSLYQKKGVFGGATAELKDNITEGNGSDLKLDDFSHIIESL